VKFADLNADGITDLATSNALNNTVSVWLGEGLGFFGPRRDFETGRFPRFLAIEDMDGDGVPDLVTGNVNDDSISVLPGFGDGTFFPRQDIELRQLITNSDLKAFGVDDVNGDRLPDIVIAYSVSSADPSVGVLLGSGDGTFGAIQSSPTIPFPSGLTIGDLDGDRVPDLVVTGVDSRSMGSLRGVGDGTFIPGEVLVFDERPGPAAIGDLNGDRVPDLVTTFFLPERVVAVYPGVGDGTFHARFDYPGRSPSSAVVVDLNGDRAPDLVATNGFANFMGDGTVSVLINLCEFPEGCNAADLAEPFGVLDLAEVVAYVAAFTTQSSAADLNGDGLWDLADITGFVTAFMAGCP
jgi:hypothetical protein